jgi:hypothetical protein
MVFRQMTTSIIIRGDLPDGPSGPFWVAVKYSGEGDAQRPTTRDTHEQFEIVGDIHSDCGFFFVMLVEETLKVRNTRCFKILRCWDVEHQHWLEEGATVSMSGVIWEPPE